MDQSDFEAARQKAIQVKAAINLELDKLRDFIVSIDPGLTPIESSLLTAYVLSELPQMLKRNPILMTQLKEVIEGIKRNQHRL